MPVIFAGMAVIFLLMIIVQWGGQGDIFSSGKDQGTIAVVNGRKIMSKEYDDALRNISENMKAQQKRPDLTESDQLKAQDQAWDELISQGIIRNSIEKIGVMVSDQEIRDQLFENPPEFIKRQFTDSLGQFHQKEYVEALRNKKNDSLVRVSLEEPLREQLLMQKWQNIMLASVRVSESEQKDRFNNESSKANIEVLKFIPPTADVQSYYPKVSDADMKKYYDEHLWDYKVEEQRKIKFVMFKMVPSPKDSAVLRERLESIKHRFSQAAPDMVDSVGKEVTSDFSETRPYMPNTMIGPGDFGTDDVAFKAAKPGDVVSTVSRQGMGVARIHSIVDTGATSFHARHILIKSLNPKDRDSCKAVAEKIYEEIKAGGDFAKLAEKYSQDKASGARGGDLGWASPGQFVPAVEQAANIAPIGELQPPVASQFGYHVMQVLDRSNRHFVASVIPIDLKPSSQTTRIINQQASIFRDHAAKSGFDVAAKEIGEKVIDDAPPVMRKGSPIFGNKPFVDWVFTAEKGEISSATKLPVMGRLLVGQVADIIPAGPKTFEAAKEEIRGKVAKRMAVEALVPKAKQAREMIGSTADLNRGASDSNNRPFIVAMGPAESVNGIPTDYIVNNTAYSMKQGEVSQILKGENGIYIIKLLQMNPMNEQAFQAQKATQLANLLREKQQRFLQGWIEKEKETAKIEDFRNKR